MGYLSVAGCLRKDRVAAPGQQTLRSGQGKRVCCLLVPGCGLFLKACLEEER